MLEITLEGGGPTTGPMLSGQAYGNHDRKLHAQQEISQHGTRPPRDRFEDKSLTTSDNPV